MGVRRSRDDWADVLAEFDASGETLAQFCAKRRIRPRTFSWWRWRLRGGRHVGPESVRLVAVDLKPTLPTTPPNRAVFVHVANVDVRVEIGTDVAYVADLVGALRSRC